MGDLGTLRADSEGRVAIDTVNNLIKLWGLHNIIGRGLVLRGRDAGARLACAVIGILEEEQGSFISMMKKGLIFSLICKGLSRQSNTNTTTRTTATTEPSKKGSI